MVNSISAQRTGCIKSFKLMEVATPVTGSEPKRRLAEILQLYLKDRRESWVLEKDGEYHRVLAGLDDDARDPRIHHILMNLASGFHLRNTHPVRGRGISMAATFLVYHVPFGRT